MSSSVCAGHGTEREVLLPGNRGADGQEKRKGVIVRCGLEDAQSESAGRST